MKIIEVKTDYQDILDIEIILGNVCNYKCTYCFPGSNEGNLVWPDKNFDLMIKNIKSLLTFYKTYHNKKRFNIKPVGGEPTLWSRLEEFITTLKENNDVYIRMSTNASRTLRYWKENSHLFDEVIISVHPEYADVNHILEVSNFIFSTKLTNLYVTVLMDPFNWDNSVKIINELKNSNSECHLGPVPVLINGSTIYNSEQLDFISNFKKRQPLQPHNFTEGIDPPLYLDENRQVVDMDKFKVLNYNLTNYKGYECNLGIDRIYINREGFVGGACGQKIFSNNFSIYKDDIESLLENKPNKPVICQQDKCLCAAEIILSKKCLTLTN